MAICFFDFSFLPLIFLGHLLHFSSILISRPLSGSFDEAAIEDAVAFHGPVSIAYQVKLSSNPLSCFPRGLVWPNKHLCNFLRSFIKPEASPDVAVQMQFEAEHDDRMKEMT